MSLKRSLSMLLDPAPLMMAGLFTLVMAFAHAARLYGIPASLIVTSWFFKYCFTLFDAVVAGDREPPVLSYEIVHPLNGEHSLFRSMLLPLGVALPLILPDYGALIICTICFIIQMVVMMVFAISGALVFAHRLELGIETLTPEERRAIRKRREFEIERGRMLDRTYAMLRLKRRAEAWGEIQRWIRAHCTGNDVFGEYHTLLTATSAWDDPSIADRVASAYLDRLLSRSETGMAVDVLAARLVRHPGFRPAKPETTVRLIELARFAGRASLSRQLELNAGTQKPELAGPGSSLSPKGQIS